MNQIKIGRFIAERRKMKNMTQMQLAEILGITDRAISKWENGKSMPDSSIMLDLCEILDISVNDLLSGEVVLMNEYNRDLENNLLEMIRQKELADQRLLKIEVIMAIICIIPILTSVVIVSFIPLKEWIIICIVLASIIPLLIATPFAIKIEQSAGYYRCDKCDYRYVPEYNDVLFAMHMGTTRYMKCPKCHKRSWQKKVLNKE